MDLAHIIINFGLFVATVIAATIAWTGVRDSRKARALAAEFEAKALTHAQEAASAASAAAEAQRRAAEAIEEANIVERKHAMPRGLRRWYSKKAEAATAGV